MKKTLTKILSVMLIVCITLTSGPLGGLVGFKLPDWLDFSVKSKALSDWSFDFDTGVLTLSSNVETGMLNGQYTRPWNNYANDIKKVIIGDNVTIIDWFSFVDCINLSQVVFGKNLEVIEDDAFKNCINLVDVSFPDSIMSIGESAFDNTGFYNDVSNWEKGVLYSGKVLLASNDSINDKYYIKPGTKVISDDAFYCNMVLTDVVIPDSVINVGYASFAWCENLSNISISDNVLYISDRSFYGTSFERNESNWDDGALYLEKYLLDVRHNVMDGFDIKPNTKVIGTYAFDSCNSISKIIIPESVLIINKGAFQLCRNLREVVIEDGVTTICRDVFYGCKLTSITIPDSVIKIGSYNFFENPLDVYYGGTEEQWKKISISSDYNYALSKSTIHYNNCNHIFGQWTTVTPSTCNESGFQRRICVKCYKADTKYIPKLDHNIEIDTATIPTCTETGLSTGEHCSRCDYKIEQTVIDALGHKYESIVRASTCTTQGYTTYTCSACGDTYTSDYIDALGHTAGEIVEENYVASTCSATGSKENVTYCTVCNTETSRETITIPALGHTEKEIPAVAPTCTETGLTTGTKCSVCDEVLEPQQEVPALGHDIITDDAVAPDCTNTGLTAGEHCSRCDYKVEQTAVDALGHKYESVVTAPTCTSQGYTTYTCHCGDTYIGDYVDAVAHNYKDGICIDCETPDPTYFTFEIQQPSRTTIRCNDGIKLHTKITGNLPYGSRIEWTKNNNNFNMTTSASGNEITIISKNNGYTTFTATVYDVDNNVIAQDTVEMYSKAGLFDKIGGFFRSLFGTTKIYDN